jgi:serine/threonine protein kinase
MKVSHFLQLAIMITKILNSIHSKGILHGDIKPENVLYNEEKDLVYLIDFSESRSSYSESKYKTQYVGTPSYTSPEQTGRLCRSVDLRSDLYNLGTTFNLSI